MAGEQTNYFLSPKSATLAVTYDADISSDTTITLNAKTAVLIVTAIGKGVFINWDTAATNSAFKEYVGAGLTQAIVRPDGVTTAHVLNETATGGIVVIEK